MKFPKVAIITTTFNQDEKVEKCLRYLLKKTDYPKYKIYFLDDSGTGEIAKKVKKLFKKVDVSSNNSNLGYAISNNILMKRAIKEFSPISLKNFSIIINMENIIRRKFLN